LSFFDSRNYTNLSAENCFIFCGIKLKNLNISVSIKDNKGYGALSLHMEPMNTASASPELHLVRNVDFWTFSRPPESESHLVRSLGDSHAC
jgi:hypothetical protein